MITTVDFTGSFIAGVHLQGQGIFEAGQVVAFPCGQTAPRTAEAERLWETMATEKLGIKVEKNPHESKIADLGVRQWPKWGCPPSKFPWTYTAKETCYLLEGKVKVYPEGHGDGFVEIEAGDLVEFSKGMKCTWDVSVAVDKHYNFE